MPKGSYLLPSHVVGVIVGNHRMMAGGSWCKLPPILIATRFFFGLNKKKHTRTIMQHFVALISFFAYTPSKFLETMSKGGRMFLNRDELIELTGYKYRHKQIEWLAGNGYRFAVDANGSPKVLIKFVEEAIGYHKTTIRKKSNEPDFSALRG